MKTAGVLLFVDNLFLHHYERRLTAPERLVIVAAWQEKTYEQVSQGSGYLFSTINRKIAPKVWRELSQALGQTVGKKNFRHVIATSTLVANFLYPDALNAEKPDSSPRSRSSKYELLGAQPPDVSKFYGRHQEMKELQALLASHRWLMLVGLEGIGKRSLLAKMTQDQMMPFDRIIWKPVHHQPPVEQLVHDLLVLVKGTEVEASSFQAEFSALVERLRANRCLLIMDTVDALLVGSQAEYRRLHDGYFSFFRRLIEETDSSIITTSNQVISQAEDYFSPRGYPAISYSVGGLTVPAAKRIFAEVGLKETSDWDEGVSSLGRHPLLLRQIANWIKTRWGGDCTILKQKTIQMNVLQYWFDDLFDDAAYLSPLDRQVLKCLANLQLVADTQRVPISRLLEQNRIFGQSIDRLIRSALVSVTVDATTREQLLSLSSLLQKYLLADPRGLVESPYLDQLA
jgi:hypothetical protein